MQDIFSLQRVIAAVLLVTLSVIGVKLFHWLRSEKSGKIGNIDERNILFIGDSVLEMTKPELYKKYPCDN